MDLIDILKNKIDTSSEMTLERKEQLCKSLTELDEVQAKTVYKLIMTYKKRFDNERRVGDTGKEAPYYAEETSEGMKFHFNMIPETLALILEQYITS